LSVALPSAWDTTNEHSPLEEFLRDFVAASGGAWEEVEPQVYDLLLSPPDDAPADAVLPEGILRITLDPEALSEHPGSQLASFGTPLVEGLLAEAMRRGRYAEAYYLGLHVQPHDLARRVRRAVTVPEGAELELGRVRRLDAVQAVYWFEASFVSDQREQEILCVAIDLCTGRQVRHLDQLLDFSRLSQQPEQPLLEARRQSAAAAYPTVREQVLRTVSALANVRRRELSQRVERQVQRMTEYYRDLRSELAQQEERSRKRQENLERFAPRTEAIGQEERLRISEVRKKHALQVRLRLLSLLLIHQPKLFLAAELAVGDNPPATLRFTWDPLVETLEAVTCPNCQAPTYVLQVAQRRIVCPQCGRAKRTPK
jgi:hypothetical protein